MVIKDITTVGIKGYGYHLADWVGFHLFGGGVAPTLVSTLIIIIVGFIDNLDA
jgi:hypothetical protein